MMKCLLNEQVGQLVARAFERVFFTHAPVPKSAEIKREPLSPQVLADANVMIANGHLQSGRYSEAIEALNNALKHDPQFAKAYYLMGMARTCRGEHALAIGHYSQAIALRPDKASYYFSRARAYDSMRQPRHAKDDYGRVLLLDGDHEGARQRHKELSELLEAPLPALTDADTTKGNCRNRSLNTPLAMLCPETTDNSPMPGVFGPITAH